MASRLDEAAAQVQAVNGKKIYVASQASTSSSASKRLDNIAFRNSYVCGTAGVLLVLQCDQDFRYNFSAGSGTATTDDIMVKSGDQEYVYTEAGDTYLNVIRNSADGTVRVYRVV